MVLAAEQIVQNRYRIESQLGQGGMAAVYQAVDTRLNVMVAIKEMMPQPGLDSQTLALLRQQFQQEAMVLARLNHPHLVRVTDFFNESNNAYLVMDFVKGYSLAKYIERWGMISEPQVLAWAGELLDALSYCHAQGVIHRDIKPQNVIIRPDGQAMLVDFGLVKLWNPNDPRTQTVMRGMGTPEYSPPEQYDAGMGHTDPRSDIYSLGATLYHTLTGQAPPTATLRMADPERFYRIWTEVRGVSERTQGCVFRALELQRSQRWQTAAEMAAALGLHAQPQVLAAPVPGAPTGKPAGKSKAKRKSEPQPAPPSQPESRAPSGPMRGGTVAVMPSRQTGPGAGSQAAPVAQSGPVAAPQQPIAAPIPAPRPVAQPGEKHRKMPVWVWGLIGVAVILLAVAGGIRISRMAGGRATETPTPSPTLAATATPSPSPTRTPTATSEPDATPTTLPTSTSVLLPEPELAGPRDDQGYYPTSLIQLSWSWSQALETGQRFLAVVENEAGEKVLQRVVDDPGAALQVEFRASDENLALGIYTWYVIVERQVGGNWEAASQSVSRTFRVVERPPETQEKPTPTPAPTTQPTTQAPTSEPTTQAPTPEPTTQPPTPEPTTQPPTPEPTTQPPTPEPTTPPPTTEPPPPPPP
ncbi:MAG: protein kinase [Anaerolineae bacterium]|nr:protein kinase [Anaerolineae bacterium]